LIFDLTKVTDTPIWGDAVGIIIGCIIGVYIPKLMLGNSSDTRGLNKVTSKSAFLGDLDTEQLDTLINKDLSLLAFRSRMVFNDLDENMSGTLDMNEIKSHLEKAMGED